MNNLYTFNSINRSTQIKVHRVNIRKKVNISNVLQVRAGPAMIISLVVLSKALPSTDYCLSLLPRLDTELACRKLQVTWVWQSGVRLFMMPGLPAHLVQELIVGTVLATG